MSTCRVLWPSWRDVMWALGWHVVRGYRVPAHFRVIKTLAKQHEHTGWPPARSA